MVLLWAEMNLQSSRKVFISFIFLSIALYSYSDIEKNMLVVDIFKAESAISQEAESFLLDKPSIDAAAFPKIIRYELDELEILFDERSGVYFWNNEFYEYSSSFFNLLGLLGFYSLFDDDKDYTDLIDEILEYSDRDKKLFDLGEAYKTNMKTANIIGISGAISMIIGLFSQFEDSGNPFVTSSRGINLFNLGTAVTIATSIYLVVKNRPVKFVNYYNENHIFLN